MLKPPLFGSQFRHVRRAVLTASILPAALAVQAWAVDWNGPVAIDINPTVAVGLVEGKADGLPFDLVSPNNADGPDRNGLGAGVSLGLFMGQETANFAQGTTADFDNFWNDNRTWIYTGEINSGPAGLLSFAESIDDSVRILIDGAVVLQDQVWNVPTASGVLQFTPNTYHTIEVRMGNGVGLAGPVSLNNFVANVPTDPPTADGYGFGFSQTGATGTDGANYSKPIDPGDGTLFRHELAPAAAANQDINVLGNTVVTLQKTTSDHITENSISFVQAAAAVTLTVNGSTPGGTLRSLNTVLAAANSKTVTINGDADFAPGALSTGPTVGTDTLTGIVLQKNGGAGKLILDNPTNNLTGTTLKVIDGTLSIVGGGGTMNPVSDVATPIEIGGTTTTLAPVLRIGGGLTGTTFANRFYARQSGTVEHISPGIDTIAGTTFAVDSGKTLTFNIANGGLILGAAAPYARTIISSSLSTTSTGGTIRKLGNNTTLQLTGTTFVQAIKAEEGRLEVAGQLRGLTLNPAITIGATATLALTNTDAVNYNRLPATVTITTGTLEGVPGAFRSGAAGDPTILNLNGGALTLGPGFSVSPTGLVASLYPDGDGGANAAFNSYANYVNYFATRTQNATVTNTGANGYASLEFGLPIGGDPQMFVPIAPTFLERDTLVSRMQGKINITVPGLYTFGSGSDDGSMLYVDGQTVVSNNVYQAHTRRTGAIALSKGLHDIDIGFYEGGGLNSLVVDWAGPGVTGTETIPNSVLIPIPAQTVTYNNPVTVAESSTINVGAASVASVSMTAGKTLSINGYRFGTGALTLNAAGTYTFNTNTPFSETVVSSIADAGAAVAIVKNGPGTLVLEAGVNPQLQNAASTITATAGGLGVVLGGINPTGNATVNVNGLSLVLSSKGGDQSYPLPTFSNGGSITARRVGSGVAGTTGTPIRVTLTGNLALSAATTLDLGTADNYILATAGISGNATVNVVGTVETNGVVNVGGPLNVVSSKLTAAQSVSAGPISIDGSTVTAASTLASTGAVAVSGSTLTANGISGTSLAITNSTVTNTGNIAVGASGVTITGGATVSSILNLHGGAITGGPITAEGAVIHATTGVTNATSATFTGLNPTGLFARFVRRPGGGAGIFWPAQTQAGILAIETDTGPFTVEKPLTTALSFLPYQAADATISTFFNGAAVEPNQFAMGFFGNFTAPVDGQYQMQVTQVDDDAGWWIDLDNDGVFETAGANGNELMAARNCCGDSPIGMVNLIGGRTYKVGIGVEDGQGGSSLVGMIGIPGEGLQVIDPSNPAQDGWWHYGLPNQVTVDAGAKLNMEAINGSVNVLVNGELGLTGTGNSSMTSLIIGAGATVVAGGAAPSAAEEPIAGAELAGDSVAAVPEPATPVLMLLGALGLFARRQRSRA